MENKGNSLIATVSGALAGVLGSAAVVIGLSTGGSSFDPAAFCFSSVVTYTAAPQIGGYLGIARLGPEELHWPDTPPNRLATHFYLEDGVQKDEVVAISDEAAACFRGSP